MLKSGAMCDGSPNSVSTSSRDNLVTEIESSSELLGRVARPFPFRFLCATSTSRVRVPRSRAVFARAGFDKCLLLRFWLFLGVPPFQFIDLHDTRLCVHVSAEAAPGP